MIFPSTNPPTILILVTTAKNAPVIMEHRLSLGIYVTVVIVMAGLTIMAIGWLLMRK